MIKNYFKIAIRNVSKHKVFSIINIGGLAVGMAVVILIGLWMWDELSYNKHFANYDRLARVMQSQTFNGVKGAQTAVPYLLGDEIKEKYGSDFKYVVMASGENGHVITVGDKVLIQTGGFFEPAIAEMLSLKMLKGTRNGLADPSSILLSASAAKAFFGDTDPINKMLKIDNTHSVKVTGVYENLPYNTDFKELNFIAPWKLYIDNEEWIEKASNPWRRNSFSAYAQIADNADMTRVSAKIKDVKLNKVTKADAAFKPVVFLHPMDKWHLYSKFENGISVGGRITFVWLFGIIGAFVLLLACINFMNLSTARSEKRAKEVGIRKVAGSERWQLILQFFCESFLIVLFAFVLSLVLVQLVLPMFNGVADKRLSILWSNSLFWSLCIGFCMLTALLSGSYPALYLSSFQPVKVLKGKLRTGRLASLPRKVLVVLQFTVSITLIIGTVIVFRQIQYAQDRSVGYNRDGLVIVPVRTQSVLKHYDALRNDLVKSGAVMEMSQSSNPTTGVWAINNGYEWKGMQPGDQGNFGTVAISHDFGKTIGWQIKAGRDFSREYPSDSSAIILNEAAVKFMNLKNPVGEIVKCDGKSYQVIGVIKDMVMDSPYTPVFRTVFMLDYSWVNIINVKLNPALDSKEALSKIGAIFRKYDPEAPFEYRFIKEEYSIKFSDEDRIGKLASGFAMLAILISCLGLFGLASFVAEQRTKEIGVRKVLGATVFNLWRLISKDFVLLVIISFFIATPLAYYFMSGWLQRFEYRTEMSWWIFVFAGLAAILITLLTVSYQAIKAAIANPVKSLRTE
ncbi:ABC transporter permease [Solitalea canadensis]|uniref:ABC-type antimicrobial peptide transport system, permease component n=1 Tax=Solitalea canadensis (strain ATCC 29591 / DSM 3403 / JCM 21819 / LMG 8368 / NBRC 15130 / NCIMB 12057 / USAM 9D) TaxID=929556 RepID=H8KSU9_SOLCM|nr:ABC transporter permease [Solitalea canadensis]AFD05409.1 ABC-type antimicrobial peptide transport system, permease component [Solitalea canadensis DSM 3403]